MIARCGCAVDAPEADPTLYPCPCGDHCDECKPARPVHKIGDRVTFNGGYAGTVVALPSYAAGMVVVRGASGETVIPAEDAIPATATCPACGRPGVPAGHVCGRCDWED